MLADMDCMWRDEKCGEVGINRGLCSKHHGRARHNGTLASYDPNAGRVCKVCSTSLAGRRAGAQLCSQKCKDDARTRDLRDRSVAAKAERRLTCAWCREPLDPERRSRRFCSTECKRAFGHNAESVLRERAAKAERQPCAFCGGPIPRNRRANAVYCSAPCKNAGTSVGRDRSEWGRRYNLQYLYGLTVEEFDERLAAQGGVCAICSTDEPGGRRSRFIVDHCHGSGRLRDLLCDACNLGLGKFGDDPARLRAAADYLDHHAGVLTE